MKWWPTPEQVDAWRVVPRILVSLYGLMCWRVAEWFMGLPDPSATQVTFASTIWGAAAAWFAFYVNSGGRKWDLSTRAYSGTSQPLPQQSQQYGQFTQQDIQQERTARQENAQNGWLG